jgi:ribosome-associated translation inhibitor RaiA
MIQILFRHLEKSELAREAVKERLAAAIEKFPDLETTQIQVTLSMENSPTQAGQDLFKVKFHCRNGRYRGLLIEKSAPNLYFALAELVDHLLERLNRFGDRARVKELRQAREVREQRAKSAEGA